MNSILLDTGTFLLLVVGSTKRELVERHRTTRDEFSTEDFATLEKFLMGYTTLYVTARCIAETSNLIRRDQQYATACMLWLKNVFGGGLGEHFQEGYVRFHTLAQSRHFEKFGVADISVLQFARHVSMTVTCDGELFNIIADSGYQVALLNDILSFARRRGR